MNRSVSAIFIDVAASATAEASVKPPDAGGVEPLEEFGSVMRFNRDGESVSFYVVLLYVHDVGQTDMTKVPTLIVVTKNPLQDVTEHNHGTVRHRFGGKTSGAHCRMQMIIGPVDSHDEALDIQQQWKVNSRGLIGRGAEGRDLARRFARPCFDAHFNRDYEKVPRRSAKMKRGANR